MIFELTVLGCNSAVPANERHPSAQVLNHNQALYLIDCGESTQFQLKNYQVKYSKIDHIFISHLHGDHYFGLIGLISTFHLMGRERALYIYGPKELESILCIQLEASNTTLKFPLFFTHTKQVFEKIYENKALEVYSIPLLHRIPTTGFLFKEKEGLRKINKEKVKELDLEHDHYRALQLGQDIETKQGKFSNQELTLNPVPPKSYAYCSDTGYFEPIIPQIKEVDLLYHETTFEKKLNDRAIETQHSTTKDAGTIADKAKVKKLLIGHYSSRYKDVNPLVKETQEYFSNVEAAEEGITYQI